MNRDDEIALVQAWHEWRVGKAIDDDLYLEFFDRHVRTDARFARIHVFEVLDALVNAPDDQRRSA
jgi:hypothetical protein